MSNDPIARLCDDHTTHGPHAYQLPPRGAYCKGRTLMGNTEVMTDCLDCEILAPEKCVFHGKHGGHRLQLLAYKNDEDGTWANRYYCNDCKNWAWL